MVNLSKHGYAVSLQLDGTGRNLRIVGLLVAVLDHTLNGDAVFLCDSVQQAGITHNHLQYAVHIS